jgi:hypothetical protein
MAPVMVRAQDGFGDVQGAEDEAADAQSDRDGHAGGAELQRCFEEGDRQDHPQPREGSRDGDGGRGCSRRGLHLGYHDPKPLRREFEATHPGAFTWDYLESGPGQWQVRTGRTQVPDTGAAAGRK